VVDWDASTVIASGQGPVWVLSTYPDERERLRRELITKLDGLETTDGRPIIASADPAAAVYDGPHTPAGPDLVLRQAPGVHIDDRIGSGSVFATPDDWRAENTETGLCIAHGPSIDPAGAVDDLRITDLAPTITHLHGYPVPEEMDGSVRTALFAPDSDPANRAVETRPALARERATASGPDTGTQQRLEDLGYL